MTENGLYKSHWCNSRLVQLHLYIAFAGHFFSQMLPLQNFNCNSIYNTLAAVMVFFQLIFRLNYSNNVNFQYFGSPIKNTSNNVGSDRKPTDVHFHPSLKPDTKLRMGTTCRPIKSRPNPIHTNPVTCIARLALFAVTTLVIQHVAFAAGVCNHNSNVLLANAHR